LLRGFSFYHRYKTFYYQELFMTQILIRRGTTAQWATAPIAVLAAGELGLDTDTKLLKVGDGTKSWTSLPGAFVGTATTATNLASGAAGSLPYQSAAGTTTMLGVGTNGSFLSVSAGVPAWSTPKLSAFASTTSAELFSVISDETGAGSLVFSNTPALVSPSVTSAGAVFKGTSTGSTTLVSGLTGTTNYTLTLPAETATLLTAATANTTYLALAGGTLTGGLSGTTITATGQISGATLKASGLTTAGIVTNTNTGVLGTTTSVPVANGGTGGTDVTTGRQGLRVYVQQYQPTGTVGNGYISGYTPQAGDLWFW
jgi:hypothetical protein